MLDLLNHWEKNGNTVCEFFLKFVSLLPFLTVIRLHAEYITIQYITHKLRVSGV